MSWEKPEAIVRPLLNARDAGLVGVRIDEEHGRPLLKIRTELDRETGRRTAPSRHRVERWLASVGYGVVGEWKKVLAGDRMRIEAEVRRVVW